jgi:hypothetical protein
MLIQTVAQLERQAADHVSLLQESLQRSSQAALAYMTKLDDYDKDVSVEKVCSRIYGYLVAKNKNFKNV